MMLHVQKCKTPAYIVRQDISSYNELAFVSLGGLQNLPEGEKQKVLELELEYVNPISQKAGLYV